MKRFDPRLGPLEGGTNLTIEGVNLGKTYADIASGITVAGMPCHPYEHLYVQTRRIVCLVDSPKSNEPRRGPVIVRVSNFKGESADFYEFVNPAIEGIEPSRGPRSGGTLLTIRGQFMNAGSSITAMIHPETGGPVLPCSITFTNATHAMCRTSASDRLRSGELRMGFDKGMRRFTRQLYEYVEDPTIEYAESGVISQVKVPKGIPSGGIIISVTGNNLEYIQVLIYSFRCIVVCAIDLIVTFKHRSPRCLCATATWYTRAVVKCYPINEWNVVHRLFPYLASKSLPKIHSHSTTDS